MFVGVRQTQRPVAFEWIRTTKQGTTGAHMNDISLRRFVTAAEKVDFVSPWTLEEWLCRSDVVKNEQLLLVRANMEPFRSHPFHKHPTREELIYIISGRAEQWVSKTHRVLGPGEMAFIPMGEIHGTYNPFNERLVFLAILSPSNAPEPGIVDVSTEEPWASLRKGFPPVT
jgi:quercetin dioxygenase-like cupin family protein